LLDIAITNLVQAPNDGVGRRKPFNILGRSDDVAF